MENRKKYGNKFIWWHPISSAITETRPSNESGWERFDSKAEFKLFCQLKTISPNIVRQKKIDILPEVKYVPAITLRVDFFIPIENRKGILIEYKGGWAEDSQRLFYQLNMIKRKFTEDEYIFCTQYGNLLPKSHFAKSYECHEANILWRIKNAVLEQQGQPDLLGRCLS